MANQYRLWTDEDIEVVKGNLHLTHKELSSRLDRSAPSVRMKIKNLGLQEERRKLNKSKVTWTDEEILYLKENFSTSPLRKMAEYLNRSERSINLKGNRLGIKRERRKYDRWTREDVAYLEENYGEIDTAIIARELGRSESMVKQKANNLDLFVDRIVSNNTKGVKLKCTYMDNGMKKSRSIFYPTEQSKKNATARAIDSLTNYMKFTDVKVVEVIKL